MEKRQSDADFRMMALWFKLRDLLHPPLRMLEEVEIKPGLHVLDYGCGPGSYVPTLAQLVGRDGMVYALDINPLAVKMVESLAAKTHLGNVNTICSDCATGLPNKSIDLAILFDTLHGLTEPQNVLRELHRVLKPNGVLALSDHHMKEEDILRTVGSGNLFTLSRKSAKTFSFSRRERSS